MFLATLYNPQIVQPIANFSGPQYINRIVPILIYFGLILCAIAFIILLIVGGIKYITSEGDKAKLEGARSTIGNSITGIIILLLLWFILQILNLIFGVNFGGIGVPLNPPILTPGPTLPPLPTGFCTSDCVSWTDVVIDGCTPEVNWDPPRNSVCMTSNNTVHVQLGEIFGATQVQIQNFSDVSLWCHDNNIDWSGVPISSYNGATTIYPWNLSAGTGEKKVCARFINPSGGASCCGGMIEVIAVGGPCNSGSDCASGLCGQDLDGDTFKGLGTGICMAPAEAVDCNDNNNLVYPGQTQYFQTPISGSNYDYDCNGANDKWPRLNCLSAPPHTTSCSTTPLPENVIRPLTGWRDYIPDCGATLLNPYQPFYLCTASHTTTCTISPGVSESFSCSDSCLTGNQCGWGHDQPCASWEMLNWSPWSSYLDGVTQMPCK